MKRKLTILLTFALILSFLPAVPMAKAAQKPKLNVKKLDMTLGTTFQLQTYNMKKKHRITFRSLDDSVASVASVDDNSRSAVIQAQGIGTTAIKVIVRRPQKNKLILRCRINVTPQAVSIKFIKKKLQLKPGQRYQTDIIIKPSASTERPIYESSDSSVASINPFGLITAVSPGTVTIRATALSTNQVATCTVVVLPYAASSTSKGDHSSAGRYQK